MKCLCLLLLVGAALAEISYETPASQDFLKRQDVILKLFHKIYQPIQYAEQAEIVKTYEPLSNLGNYKHQMAVKELVKLQKIGKLVPRGEVFSLLKKEHLHQMSLVFEALYFAKDWDTFYKTAVWARHHVNEGQYVYALSVAVLHRNDTQGIRLPADYEIFPNLYVNPKVLREAYLAQQRQQPAVIYTNATGIHRNVEQRLAYFREDVGLNNFYSQWHKRNTFWDQPAWELQKDRQGELYFHMLHNLIARYNLERISNDMPEVEELKYTQCIREGYAPRVSYIKDGELPARPDCAILKELKHGNRRLSVQDLMIYESRIRDAIYRNAVMKRDGTYESLHGKNGIDILGSLVEATQYSKHHQYYGSLNNFARAMIARVTDPKDKYNQPPSVLEHYQTATRDPAFYTLGKRIDSLLKEYKDQLPPYTREQLKVQGLAIEDVHIDELVTFFENHDIDLNNVLYTSEQQPTQHDIKARIQRINHKPFTYKIKVQSDKERIVTVRTFIGPKHNYLGNEIPLQQKRWQFVELDKFAVKVNTGKNVVERKSTETSSAIPEYINTQTLKKQVSDALQGSTIFRMNKDHQHCGMPTSLLLPKGKPEGMPFTLYVMVTDYEQDKVNDYPYSYKYGGSISFCGALNTKFPDRKPMGYPFDRPIVEAENFVTENMFFRDVVIRFQGHKHASEHQLQQQRYQQEQYLQGDDFQQGQNVEGVFQQGVYRQGQKFQQGLVYQQHGQMYPQGEQYQQSGEQYGQRSAEQYGQHSGEQYGQNGYQYHY